MFRSRTLSANEGEGDGPTEKDNNESVCGRSGSSMVMLGLPTMAPNGAPAPEHAATSTRGGRINLFVSCQLRNVSCLSWLSVLGARDDATGFEERSVRNGVMACRGRVPLLCNCIVIKKGISR